MAAGVKEDEGRAVNEFEHVTEEEDEVDPLDAFMTGLESKVSETNKSSISKYEMEDEHDDQLQAFAKDLAKQNALAFKKGETLEAIDYDSDDNLVPKKKIIESLPPLDHRSISYPSFNKSFFRPSQSATQMTEDELRAARNALSISVSGKSIPRLVTSFTGFNFPEKMSKAIVAQGFERPTPIQMQAVPVAMEGRDVLGIAATGSGKTLSFVWPMLVHIAEQPPLKEGEPGPMGIIVAPTRELADQLYEEARKYAKCFERKTEEGVEKAIRVAPLLGGIGLGNMRSILRNSSHELVVATPGRLIEIIKLKLISTYRTTMLVLDEADKMFDMGFEPQLKSIVGQIRPDRQTLLFSATFKPTIENLARDILRDPVRISIGTTGAANKDITQIVEILRDDAAKWHWLSHRLEDFVLDGSVLIFAGSKASVEELAKNIKEHFGSISTGCLHGDKTSDERNRITADFKNGKFPVLVATDVAARGLDVPQIKTVINFQSARDIDSHTHRIGRTGRAGDKLGIAYTLITPSETHFAGLLVKNLENAHQEVSPDLLALSRQNPKFRDHYERSRHDTGPRHPSSGGQGRSHAVSPQSSFPPSHAAYPPRHTNPIEYPVQRPPSGGSISIGAINSQPKVASTVSVAKASTEPAVAYNPLGDI